MQRLRALVMWAHAHGRAVFGILLGALVVTAAVESRLLNAYEDVANHQCYRAVTGDGATYDCVARRLAAEDALSVVVVVLASAIIIGGTVMVSAYAHAQNNESSEEFGLTPLRTAVALGVFAVAFVGSAALSIWWYLHYHY
jgi:putative intracellular protease/amidase